jgi:glutathione S-transferase
MPGPLDVAASMLVSHARLWGGTNAFRPARAQPLCPIELYEFEASPYCRLVREALTELDLDAMIYPCPSGGTRFMQKLVGLGGKKQRPYLVDPNTGRSMYESADIIEYLAETYGAKAAGTRGLRRRLAVASSYVATGARALSGSIRGFKARPSVAPEQPLELFSFEASPYARIVREVLSELEIPYLLRSFGKARWADIGPPSFRTTFFPNVPIEGRNRKRMYAETGRMQVPYLIDPNTRQALYESADIVAYLERTYATTCRRLCR